MTTSADCVAVIWLGKVFAVCRLIRMTCKRTWRTHRSALDWRAERFSRGCTSHRLVLRRGRSVPFVDPSLTALEARHIWILPAGRKTLSVAVEPARRSDKRSVFVPELPGIQHILIEADGRQHVLLRAHGAVLQLEFEGADILSQPVVPTLKSCGFDKLRRTEMQVADLRRILSRRAMTSPSPRWTIRSRNMHDAFIVHDFRRLGHRYKEAALFIHGPEAVARDWRKDALPARMRRDWVRAEQFIASGWRRYLE